MPAREPVSIEFEAARNRLRAEPRRWLVTGSAGFIGSHLLEALLRLGQHVVSVDNFATGYRRNLDDVRDAVGEQAWLRHTFIEADIADPAACRRCCERVDVVLHQAALGSVPRSIEDPLATHAANATGFLNMLVAARDAGVGRFVYAGSSSTYGDSSRPAQAWRTQIGRPLSPYAVTKFVDELYAQVFVRCYGLETIGLRYFNVFGPRQDPKRRVRRGHPAVGGRDAGRHAGRDPWRWRDHARLLLRRQRRAGQLAGRDYRESGRDRPGHQCGGGGRMSLSELYAMLRDLIGERHPQLRVPPPVYDDFRPGDVRHSQADIAKAQRLLGYRPTHDARLGLRNALPWYEGSFSARQTVRAPDTTDVRGVA